MRTRKLFPPAFVLMLLGTSALILSGCGSDSEQAVEESPDHAFDSRTALPDPTPDWSDAAATFSETSPSDALTTPPRDMVIDPGVLDAGPVLLGPRNGIVSAPAPVVQPPADRIEAPAPMPVAPRSYAMRMAEPDDARPPTVIRPAPTAIPPSGAPTVRSQPISADPTISMLAPQPAPGGADEFPPAPAARDDASPRRASPDEVAAEQADGYKRVTVFYGTDRKALEGPGSGRPVWFDGWFRWTAACAAIAVILTIVMLRLSRRRPVVALTGVSYMATFVLAVVTVVGHVQRGGGASESSRAYGNDRGVLEMGTCRVSIPEDHEVGEVERPSIFRLEFREDPKRHVVLMSVDREPEDRFFAALKDRVGRSGRKEAFVFVHGFNVTFEAAARRTAQLAYDLKFDGAPIFYSWPSQGGLLKYAVDETNVVWTAPHLKEFLTGIARRSDAEAVHLIAHSLGNRALTSALQSLSHELPGGSPMFHEVLLTAPDIDADVFRSQIAPAIVKTARRVTLYASSNDEALAMSKRVHGYPRAGDSGPGLVIVPGIDTIDVSSIDTSLIGHSYYGSNDSVIADMVDLLREANPPDRRRWLRPMYLGQMLYWIFTADGSRLGILSPPQPTVR